MCHLLAANGQTTRGGPSICPRNTDHPFRPARTAPNPVGEDRLCRLEQQESLLDFSSGTPFHSTLCKQADDFFQLLEPLCTSHACACETYQQAYHEMQLELLEPTFRGYWHLCTTWGYKPLRHVS